MRFGLRDKPGIERGQPGLWKWKRLYPRQPLRGQAHAYVLYPGQIHGDRRSQFDLLRPLAPSVEGGRAAVAADGRENFVEFEQTPREG